MKEKAKAILDRIAKIVLNDGPVQLAEMKLDDGSTLFAAVFEPGESVFIIDGEDRLPLPIGEYTLEDGSMLIVTSEGVIDSINAAQNQSAEELESIEKKVTEIKEELSKVKQENEQLKLSQLQRATKGIKHSPEGKNLKVEMEKTHKVKISELRSMSTGERVAQAMLNTPFYNNVNLTTSTSVTSTYAGEFAGQYIAAATMQGTTLGGSLITIKPNVKYKEVVKVLSASSLLANGTCDFTPTGTVAVTEKILTPKTLQVNLELCKSDFRTDWEAIAMGYSAYDVLPPSFQAFFAQKMAEIVNASIETGIWVGTDTAGQFEGLTVKMLADATVLDVASTTLSASNIIAQLTAIVAKIPTYLLYEPDMTIYISPTAAMFYQQAVGALGGGGYMNQTYIGAKPLDFLGIKMVAVNGLTANLAVAAKASNLWYGTGLFGDENEVKIIDMADIDGSQNVRFVMRFTAGVQYGIGSDIVLYAPTH